MSMIPVGCLDDIEVVLGHDNGIAMIAQAMQYTRQLLDVVKMQVSCRFVEKVQRVPCRAWKVRACGASQADNLYALRGQVVCGAQRCGGLQRWLYRKRGRGEARRLCRILFHI